MNCSYLDKDGKDQLAVMGCYGIGVGRTVAAAIEQHHDDDGIIWPAAIAPFEAVVLPLQMNKDEVIKTGEDIYASLKEAVWTPPWMTGRRERDSSSKMRT